MEQSAKTKERFSETNESFTMLEAINEAKRCLHCKAPQCSKGCPISQDIPDWIHELSMGNLGNAMHIINGKSNLPAVCGRVCPHERQCEGHCVLGKKGRPVAIGKLERFVADFDGDMQLIRERLPQKTRGRVAVIGSGPAGLAVAGDLARKGFAVEVFEMEPEPGGVLMFGIPEYRLPKEVVAREIRHIESMGVTIHRDTTVGVETTIDKMFEQGFDAIFIGTGTGKPKSLSIPVKTMTGGDKQINSEDLRGVRLATHFLRRMELYNEGFISHDEVSVRPGHRVMVIGCGNTAMDAARTAIRIGAERVDVVYHRGIENMAALKAEYDDAIKEGAYFNWHSSITEIHIDDQENIKEVVIETREKGEDGEEKVTRRTEPADRIIMAVGATPNTRIVRTTSGLENDEKKFLITRDIPYGMTTRKGVFAGGDVANRQATVVHAMQDAKRVAEGIAQYVDAVKLMNAIEGQ